LTGSGSGRKSKPQQAGRQSYCVGEIRQGGKSWILSGKAASFAALRSMKTGLPPRSDQPTATETFDLQGKHET
jgi:hypothetical protein